jgi:hypothetical protein
MKAIKLIAIFLGIAAILFVVFNLDAIIPDSSKGSSSDESINLDARCNEIRSAWKEEPGWNKELFQSTWNEIEQERKLGMYTENGFTTVKNCLLETAINKVCSAYKIALHGNPFDAKALQTRYSGAKELSTYEELAKEARLDSVMRIHQLYLNVSKFVNSDHTITPSFSLNSSPYWKPFNSSRNAILQTAQKYRQDALFSKVSHLPGFREGVDPDKLKKKLDSQEAGFYKKLSSQIVTAFKPMTHNQANKDQLKKVSEAYYKEYDAAFGDNGQYGAAEIAAFVQQFNSVDSSWEKVRQTL